jgi:xanthine dehydrogenase accessory factor
MVIAADGRFEGSVSGGCVEGEVISEAESILADGKPKTLTFGVEDETAWRVGLPCGGKIKVFLERLDKPGGLPLLSRAIEAGATRSGLVVRTHLADARREVFERTDARADEESASCSPPARANSRRRPRARSSCTRWCRGRAS